MSYLWACADERSHHAYRNYLRLFLPNLIPFPARKVSSSDYLFAFPMLQIWRQAACAAVRVTGPRSISVKYTGKLWHPYLPSRRCTRSYNTFLHEPSARILSSRSDAFQSPGNARANHEYIENLLQDGLVETAFDHLVNKDFVISQETVQMFLQAKGSERYRDKVLEIFPAFGEKNFARRSNMVALSLLAIPGENHLCKLLLVNLQVHQAVVLFNQRTGWKRVR